MPLVVLTYPGHFLLTALTIKSYLEHHTPTEVIVVADDLSPCAWSTYLTDCQNLYQTTIIPVSQLTEAHKFNSGWIRQQIVKLYLDQLIPHDSWFFTDGDVEYLCPAPGDSIPYVINRGGSVQDQQNNYVGKLLGIAPPVGIYAEHPHMDWEPGTTRHQVCVSNPPFRTMRKSTLLQLRNYLENYHGMSVDDLHQSLDNHTYSVSEWELIASFQLHVLKEDIPVVYYPTIPLGSDRGSPFDHCATCYNTDSAYSREWWQSKGIEISDRIWQETINIAK